jgi:hypothetical protein
MFGPDNALPLPANLSLPQTHRPLSLTEEGARHLPSGACHFVLLHPTVQNQRCSCQNFLLNRAALGSICQCGHQACYHVAQPLPREQQSRESVSLASETALLERIKRLEETIHHERDARETSFQRERVLWEREIRILREALAPFYKSEQDVKRKMIEIEDRIEGNYDEQVRLKDRVVAVDDASMNLERRVDTLESRKRRRVSRPLAEDTFMRGSSSEDRRSVPIVDDRSVHSASVSSHALSPGSNFTPVPADADEPRSSGILNLMETSVRPRVAHGSARSSSLPTEEPRSSGFLALDLAERLSMHSKTLEPTRDNPPPPPYRFGFDRQSPPEYAQSNPDAAIFRHALIPSPPELSPRKRKHAVEHLALDVLADVSMASPLVQG